MSAIVDIFRQLEGQEIPGGCNDCDAFQKVITDEEPVYTIRVFHDDTCPWLKARREGR